MSTELTQSHRVKARKEHRCDWCGKKIAVGETYTSSAHVMDGRAYTWHECDRCAPYVGPMMAYWDHRADEGYTGEDMSEYMHEEHPDVWDAWKEADHER
ncbi:hypothetical protein [Gordonibacter urolithinfaciens]|uniref:hypothetical protein n=1 Tax=Gordonibacter urolithinfaciens TaxID=1335613 RepID=UPI0034B5D4DF